MARLEGFEPTTPGSEDRCSCPLSYRRTQTVEADGQPCTLYYSTKIMCQGARVNRLPIVIGEGEVVQSELP